METPDYLAAADDSCPCGASVRFDQCCGAGTAPPKGVEIRRGVISEKRCKEIVKYLSKQNRTVSTVQRSKEDKVEVDTTERVVQEVNPGKLKKYFQKIIREQFCELVKRHFDLEVAWYERPVIMHYTAGGKYVAHADAHRHVYTVDQWVKVLDRDYSILVYLSDDFEGGELLFNRFGYRYKPRTGDVVFFPSDHRYVHTAEPVTSGNRYAVVSWCAAAGVERVQENPPDAAIPVGKQ